MVVEHDKRQLHPLHHPKQHAAPLVVDRAEGVWLHTTDGRTVLDGMAGLWNVNIGYGNHELPEVAAAQMRKIAFTSNFVGMTTPPAAELAHRMAGMAHPTLNTTFFTSGGSESNDSAFKTARYYWYRLGRKDKFKIISRQAGYHGITVAATAATGIPRYHTMFGPLAPGFSHIPAPNPYRYTGDIQPGETVGQAAARALEEEILRQGPETVAAFIAEPIQGAGGVIVPPANFWPLVREVCSRHGVLLIADEVVTGFGRTGHLFGTRLWDVQADLWCLAKGISSGYIPLGATAISQAVADVFDADATGAGQVAHGYTYSAHPVAAAAALATMKLLVEQDIPGHVARVAPAFQQRLRGLKQRHAFVGDVRGHGLMLGIEMVADPATKAPLPKTSDLPARVARAAYRRGLMVRVSGANLILSPPLVISEAELDYLCTALEGAFDDAASEPVKA
jgi:adenosylmethionine-8-amino-7-oxononanoate aminotransferase